ncbi:MAG: FAD-dependent oxidoreductase, partial [Acetobacteraceae bacterium]
MQDPKSVGGKLAAPAETFDLVVVGAGAAGAAAAIEAGEAGRRVLLVDENPVASELVGLDVPLLYGGRMLGTSASKNRLLERLVETNPGLERAFDLGIDVRLGTYVWGAFVNGPALAALPARLAGLANDERASCVGFDKLVIAAGARDLVLNFRGSGLPGVVGAVAFDAMLRRYDAFGGRRLVILGSGELALAAADLARERGLEIAAVIEAAPEPIAALPPNVALFTGHVIVRADGDASGVSAAVIAPLGSSAERRIACDTIVLAFGRVPNIELLDVLGAAVAFEPTRGGFAPSGSLPATSLPNVFVAGDCAGLCPVADPEIAARQGRAAARAALDPASGHGALNLPFVAPALPPARDTYRYAAHWLSELRKSGGDEVLACRCEEVSRADLLGIQPPRYLGARSPCMEARDIATLARDGPLSQDHVKRLTRAGMGACQGRRCREQIALLLAAASNLAPRELPLPSYRAPVRPLPLARLAAAEVEEMRAGWDVWFG